MKNWIWPRELAWSFVQVALWLLLFYVYANYVHSFVDRLIILPPNSIEREDKSANRANPGDYSITETESLTWESLEKYLEIKQKEDAGNSDPDLLAQQGMWGAAIALVFLTIFQVIFGALALLYIRETLKATRQTLKEAEEATLYSKEALNSTNESTQIELQPYLSFEFVDCDKNISVNGGPSIRLTVKIINKGKTPAFNVYVDFSHWSQFLFTVLPEKKVIEERRPIKGRPFEVKNFIPAEDDVELEFIFQCATNIEQASIGGSELFCVDVQDFCVRYKDYFCESSTHRAIGGAVKYSSIRMVRQSTSELQSWKPVTWPDSQHDYYRES